MVNPLIITAFLKLMQNKMRKGKIKERKSGGEHFWRSTSGKTRTSELIISISGQAERLSGKQMQTENLCLIKEDVPALSSNAE